MLFQGARSGLKMGSWLPADAVTPWSVRGRPLVGHWELRFGPFIVASSTRARFVTVPAAPAGNHLRFLDNNRREEAMLEQTRDEQEIIERVTALNIEQGRVGVLCAAARLYGWLAAGPGSHDVLHDDPLAAADGRPVAGSGGDPGGDGGDLQLLG